MTSSTVLVSSTAPPGSRARWFALLAVTLGAFIQRAGSVPRRASPPRRHHGRRHVVQLRCGLDASGLPGPLAAALRPLGSTGVAGGVAPVLDGADAATASAVQALTDAAFVDGMRTTMLLAACICVLGAVVALLVHRRAATAAAATDTH